MLDIIKMHSLYNIIRKHGINSGIIYTYSMHSTHNIIMIVHELIVHTNRPNNYYTIICS